MSVDVQPFDEILISGTSSSPQHDFTDLRCVVATVAADAIKVWPCDGDGKIWFGRDRIRGIVVLVRETE